MRHLATTLLAVAIAWAGLSPAAAQVVETDPTPPIAGEPVTVYFNAEEGTGGLEGYTGDIYAHTGISTTESGEGNWKCVKNYWPTSSDFSGNRSDTQMQPVDGDPNRYRLDIQDIRAFYQDTSTECSLGADEEILSMNFVFRNADGSQEGKAEGGGDIFVDVSQGGLAVTITNPEEGQYTPYLAETDETVEALATANVASGQTLQSLSLSFNGSQVASTTSETVRADLALDTPGKDVTVVARAETGSGEVVRDTVRALRNPSVTEEALPSGLKDGINRRSDTRVTFSVVAPNKSYVYLIGDFNDWTVEPEYFMKRDPGTAADGTDMTRYWITVEGLDPDTEYGFQYLVDGQIRIADPYSKQVLSPNDRFISESTYPNLKPYPTGETEQLVSAFEMTPPSFDFSAFDAPAQKDLVIYELLLRDFIEKHDYATLTDTLDYLDRLGVNAIELMPVSEWDGNISWGYNPSMHFATDKYYGPPEDLKRFVEEAHRRGIAVILDVVYNHATGQSPLVRLFNEGTYGSPTAANPWYNEEARHPFNVFNDMNHEAALTREWLDRANRYWLEEFNVDGFRFDLSKGFVQGPDPNGYQDVSAWNEYNETRINTLKRMADEIWSVEDSAYVILEHLAEPREEQELASYGTDNGKPGMMLWNKMTPAYSESAMGYISEESLTNADLSDTYYRNAGFSVPNTVTYMESHDEQWLMRRNKEYGNSKGSYDITTLPTALERQKLVGAFFFTVPGPRMMWQFGELGYGWGEDECLRQSDACDANDPSRTGPKPIRWQYRSPDASPDRVRLYKAWAAMINLRQNNEVFTSTETEVSMRVGNAQEDRRIVLEHPSMNAVVAGNFGVDTTTVVPSFPSDTDGDQVWYDFFTGEEIEVSPEEADAPVRYAPGEFHIYLSEPVDFPEGGLVNFEGAGTPPPVEVNNFEVSFQDGEAVLTWTTAFETNNERFDVQRRIGSDGTFQKVGFVDGSGTTTETKNYRFVDSGLPFEAEDVTYRLRQVSTDGTERFTETRTLTIEDPDALSLRGTAPNPVRQSARVRYEVPEEGIVRIDLFNVLGQRVRTLVNERQNPGRRETRLDASGLASGTYFLRLRGPGGMRTRRVVVIQ